VQELNINNSVAFGDWEERVIRNPDLFQGTHEPEVQAFYLLVIYVTDPYEVPSTTSPRDFIW